MTPEQPETPSGPLHRLREGLAGRVRPIFGPLPNDVPGAEMSGQNIGPYKLRERIGKGGFGDVYVADQERPVKRRVALKVIKLGMDTREVIARFEAERQALALMDHDNIAKVFDAGTTDDGRPYFVMELVKGEPITRYCDDNHLTVSERLELFTQVCQAIQHSHTKGVWHRDIKPTNVLVATVDARPRVKVIDFGIAKAISEPLTTKSVYTRFHQMIGTPAYMSPEQAGGAPDIDARTDIYSLGVLLYELLTGTLPFDAKALRDAAMDEIRRIIREEDPPRPSTRLSELHSAHRAHASAGGKDTALAQIARARRTDPTTLLRTVRKDLDRLVMAGCLAKERARRYQTAEALADDIKRYLAGAPLMVVPPSGAYLLRRFARRHRAGVIMGALLGATLCVGTIGTSTGMLRAQRKTAEAQFEAYVANISAAESALRVNEIETVQRRLDACPERLQNWEWRHLQAASDGSLIALPGLNGWGNFASFSPDGTRVVTVLWGGTAWLCDAATGEGIATLRGHDGHLVAAFFSPDGSQVVTALGDGTAQLCDAATGEEIAALRGHEGPLAAASFSPNGSWVVTASLDTTARLWDAKTGAQLTILRGHDGVVVSASFSLDSERVLTTSADHTARVWDVESGQHVAVLGGNETPLWKAAFSPDATHVVTISVDGTASIWSVEADEEVLTLHGHEGRVCSAGFSNDGARVVTASEDATARLWDAEAGTQLRTLRGHDSFVRSASFSPDSARVVTTSSDQTARVWDVATGNELATLRGHEGPPSNAFFSPDGTRVITMGSGVRIWDASTGPEVTVLRGHTSSVLCASFSIDDTRLVTASLDGTARVWDVLSGQEQATLYGHAGGVYSASFSSDGSRILTTDEQAGRIWDSATGAEVAVLYGHRGIVRSASFSPDGTLAVTASLDNTARIWDVLTGEVINELKGHTWGVVSASFSPDGKNVITASLDSTARVWDAATGKQVMLLRAHERAIESASFSTDGRRVVTASRDCTARLWNVATGKEIMLLRGSDRGLDFAALSPDGSRIVTSVAGGQKARESGGLAMACGADA